ncbi:MAG: glyoxalase [Lachnoclostridium sp.]|nr:glyoxalase [Lachnoclostridium sp.]
MKLKNMLIVVHDMERSKAFYKGLFGLEVLADYDGNVVLTEGLVLQDAMIWESLLNKTLAFGTNNAELYFEENDMDWFMEKLNGWQEPIVYATPFSQHEWGQRVVRFYDPDGHLIEVGESMDFVARRFLLQGMSVEETAAKTQMAYKKVEEIASFLNEPED